MVFPVEGELCPHRSLHRKHGLDEIQGNTPRKWSSLMTDDRRNRLDDDRARKWLASHTLKQASEPKPQWQPPERWQQRKQEQKQEWRMLRKPLLRGTDVDQN